MNLTALLTCVLCGSGAYLLARHLHLSPRRRVRLRTDLRVRTAAVFPDGPAAHDRGAVDSVLAGVSACLSRARSTRRDLLLAIGFFSLQALSSGHGAAYLFFSTVALLAWQSRPARRWRSGNGCVISASPARTCSRPRCGFSCPIESRKRKPACAGDTCRCAAGHRKFSGVAGTFRPVRDRAAVGSLREGTRCILVSRNSGAGTGRGRQLCSIVGRRDACARTTSPST